uniref:Uncharacterized protein n=1 Tax=Lepeophtheirus salmonis TaxID=72036 RepID=A0A0K2V969_LEPSM
MQVLAEVLPGSSRHIKQLISSCVSPYLFGPVQS